MSTTKKAWKCTVCGYVHYGDTPPDFCPLCGATKDLFELYEETLPTSLQENNALQWRCLNCEYIHKGESAPQNCPVCGAPADRFEGFSSEVPKISVDNNKALRIVIAGAGIAGVSAAEAVRKHSSNAEIKLLSKENHLPYYRLNLTRYLAGDVNEEDLPLHPEKWYESNGISLLYQKELCSIDNSQKQVKLRNGEKHKFDRLIITVGSHPFIPPFPGANRENVTPLRTKDDADFILEHCKSPIRVVVIGGGLLGLETAGALAKRGVDVTLLEGYGWLLPRQLNPKGGSLLENYVISNGIKLQKNARTKEIVGDDCVRGVLLENGETIPAELVVITTGVRSNSYVARIAGLGVNKGIIVNNFLQSSQQHIYAAGDVTEHQGVSYGTWGPSQFQGTIAGINAAGGNSEFAGIPRSNILKVLGYDLFSIGQIAGEDASYHSVEAVLNNTYSHFLFHDNRMVGAILLGKTDVSAQIKNLVEKGIDCSQLLSKAPDVNAILKFLQES